MKLLYKSLSPFTLDGDDFLAEAKTDGSCLTVKLTVPSSEHRYVFGNVTYNGVTESYSFYAPGEYSLFFDYVESVRSFTVQRSGETKVCSWRCSYDDPAPSVSISYTGIRSSSYFTADFTFTGESENNALVAPMIFFKSANGWTLLDYSPQKNTGGHHSSLIYGGNPRGTEYRVVLLFACYSSPSDGLEDYIGLTEYELPPFIMSDQNEPFCPQRLTYSPLKVGEPFRISWDPINDPDYPEVSYDLMRSVNGSGYVEVYEGADSSFTDTLPSGTKNVSYQICSVSGTACSPYCEGEPVPVASSNIFVGVNGEVKAVLSVYIGQNGIPTPASAEAQIG